MIKNQTESKPADAEQPTDDALDETICSARRCNSAGCKTKKQHSAKWRLTESHVLVFCDDVKKSLLADGIPEEDFIPQNAPVKPSPL